jgi:signal transduction histidine kinase/CheY-like chemotaxis protein
MRRLLALLALFVAYLATAKLGLSLASLHPSATAVWPPTGIAIAGVLLLGRSALPAIFAASFTINAITAGSMPTSLGIAVGNTIEAMTGAYLLERWAGGRCVLDRAPTIFRFVALMAPTTALSATIGVTTLALGGYALWSDYGSIWLTWWLGNLSGALVFVPLVLAWSEPRLSRTTERVRPVEIILLFSLVCLSAALTFGGSGPWASHTPLAFLTIPPLAWAAFRFGPRQTSLALAVLSAMATWNTVRGSGPFAIVSSNSALLILETFIATLTATMLAMAAVVTERRRAESERAELLAREHAARIDAETTSSAKDDFLAMLGHELRNPLSAIATAAHVLTLAEPRDGTADQAQRVISRQVKHLAKLVDDLLDLTRITTGKVTLDRRPVDLVALVSRTVDTMDLTPGVNDKRAGPAIHADMGSTPLWVRGDATRLEQIVSNLIMNAIKYTPPEGSIRIEAAHDADRVVLRIMDTGVGIDAALLPRIFDRFIQGDGGPARVQGGLGLGLTLVKHFVELHDGTVSAASRGSGLGSVFTVSLPAALPVSSDAPLASPSFPTRRRVLLVEDQADAREMMRFVLELAGHEVTEASDGPTALNAVARTAPEVAFVDIGLPGINGYEVARQVRAMRGRAVVLIALTGYGQPADRARAEEAGFDLHLVKPVDLTQVTELLERLPRAKPSGPDDEVPAVRAIASTPGL